MNQHQSKTKNTYWRSLCPSATLWPSNAYRTLKKKKSINESSASCKTDYWWMVSANCARTGAPWPPANPGGPGDPASPFWPGSPGSPFTPGWPSGPCAHRGSNQHGGVGFKMHKLHDYKVMNLVMVNSGQLTGVPVNPTAPIGPGSPGDP